MKWEIEVAENLGMPELTGLVNQESDAKWRDARRGQNLKCPMESSGVRNMLITKLKGGN